MSVSRQKLGRALYEFDESYQVSYVNYCRANELVDAQLIMTLEHRVEVGDLDGNFPYFSAKNVKNITPTA